MPNSWKWKFYSVVAAFVVGIYLLVPSVLRFDSKREALESNGQPVPSYMKLFPRKALTLGLDLQGGIYVEMQVNLADAIKRKTDLFSSDLERYLKDKNIIPVSTLQPNGDGVLHIKLNKPDEVDALLSVVNEDFSQVFLKQSITTEEGYPVVVLALQKNYRDYLESNVAKQALETVRNRIDRYGVSEPTIARQGTDRIAIELPGLSDPDRAISIIKRTGQLEFRLVDESKNVAELEQMIADARKENNIPEGFSAEIVAKINEAVASKLPVTSEISFELVRDTITKKVVRGIPYLISKKADVTGDMLQDARVSIEQNEPHVNLTFDKTGTANFGDLTKNNVKKKLAILLDGNVNKAPVINEPILSGRAQISLGYGDYQSLLKEAEDLALVLQEGALPASLSEATKTVIGPTLGQASIMAGLKAIAFAAVLVIIFMIFYYKMSGLYADIAVGLNVLLILGVLAIFGATLTLPGIAGIVLTMGMAVDANVLICERIREEMRAGKPLRAAIDAGYSNALRAVVDSNITTLIAGVVLYQFGTGPIKGFAVTLSIGILTTLFTAIVVTRLIYDYKVIKQKATTISI
ncbi:MAG: protein translocase subunit SecD [Deltaproteobacteria bacterium]|nr:protein translocase subunit SecD [Deltaproteobacteria bacterium]MBI2342600.1 protein translocase subunit SecD [Deltaproteobacteria bacterium]MBI2974541.1 protein translocase subunit SecD [Deltaproteobacteria bacterium]